MIGGGITGGENMWIKLQACRQKLSGRRLRQWGDSRPKYMGYTWSENYCSGASSFLGEILCRGIDHDERVATMPGEQALSMWRAQKLRMAAAPAIITTTTATTSSHNTSNIHNLFGWAWTTLSSHHNIWEQCAWEFFCPLVLVQAWKTIRRRGIERLRAWGHGDEGEDEGREGGRPPKGDEG